ncbi:MAG: 2-amino-4-hydroxy-6-hydroxymethyldihydropteridine diphosphokinase [Mariprofundus sp.]
MKQCIIAFGGNLGDVVAAFISARNAIGALPQTRIVRSSRLYRTAPIGPPGQPDYYNAVITINTAREPLQLLDALQAIEHEHGRIRKEHWGARTLDLDIIAIESDIIDSPRLSVPHPLMHTRQFVLRPLCDIQPDWHHPQRAGSASTLLTDLLENNEEPLAEGVIW